MRPARDPARGSFFWFTAREFSCGPPGLRRSRANGDWQLGEKKLHRAYTAGTAHVGKWLNGRKHLKILVAGARYAYIRRCRERRKVA